MERRQLIVFGAIFAVIVTVLAAVYFAFLRPGYAVLYEDIREADAAEIVGVLDQQAIDYRLEDGGHRVLVPEDEVGRARVLVAGAGVAMGGVVGFELFNETDMGLTEFAQKVNYQRALQGELARTIMGMDGVAFARVHLSLPERTLFRANQAGPKAAVTVQTEAAGALGSARVIGIQQLVSAAVTDLPARQVAVIDQRGQLLSTAPVEGAEGAPALDERSALEEYYRARTRSVAEQLIPGLPFDVQVTAIAIGGDTAAPAAPEDDRNFSLRIAVRTEAELPLEDRELLRDAITQATRIVPERGDSLRFETGPLELYEPSGIPLAADPDPAPLASPEPALPYAGDFAGGLFGGEWFWPTIAALAVLAVVLLRRRCRLSSDEQQSFADLLGENLPPEEAFAGGR